MNPIQVQWPVLAHCFIYCIYTIYTRTVFCILYNWYIARDHTITTHMHPQSFVNMLHSCIWWSVCNILYRTFIAVNDDAESNVWDDANHDNALARHSIQKKFRCWCRPSTSPSCACVYSMYDILTWLLDAAVLAVDVRTFPESVMCAFVLYVTKSAKTNNERKINERILCAQLWCGRIETG